MNVTASAPRSSCCLLYTSWFDRGGKRIASFGQASFYQSLSLSRDQKLVASDTQDSATGYEIFLFDPARGSTTQLTFGAATGNLPAWSPDGTRIAFVSTRDGRYNIYLKSSSGAGPEELLLKNDHNKFVTDWSKDGRYLLFGDQDPKTMNGDLWAMPMISGAAGDRKPFLYSHSDFDQRDAKLSPDGRWVAYSANEGPQWQVYVQAFPEGKQRRLLSSLTLERQRP